MHSTSQKDDKENNVVIDQTNHAPVIIHCFGGRLTSNPFGHIGIQLGDYYLAYGSSDGPSTNSSDTLSIEEDNPIEDEITVYGDTHSTFQLPNPSPKLNIETIITSWEKTWRPYDYSISKRNCAHSVIYCVKELGLLEKEIADDLLTNFGLRPSHVATLFFEIVKKTIQDQRKQLILNKKLNLITKIEMLLENDIARLSNELAKEVACSKLDLANDIPLKKQKILALICIKKQLPYLALPALKIKLEIEINNQTSSIRSNNTAQGLSQCLDLVKNIDLKQYPQIAIEYKLTQQKKYKDIEKRIPYFLQYHQSMNTLEEISRLYHYKKLKYILKKMNRKIIMNIDEKYTNLNQFKLFNEIIHFYKMIDLKIKEYISSNNSLPEIRELCSLYHLEINSMILKLSQNKITLEQAIAGSKENIGLKPLYNIIEYFISLKNNFIFEPDHYKSGIKKELGYFFSEYLTILGKIKNKINRSLADDIQKINILKKEAYKLAIELSKGTIDPQKAINGNEAEKFRGLKQITHDIEHLHKKTDAPSKSEASITKKVSLSKEAPPTKEVSLSKEPHPPKESSLTKEPHPSKEASLTKGVCLTENTSKHVNTEIMQKVGANILKDVKVLPSEVIKLDLLKKEKESLSSSERLLFSRIRNSFLYLEWLEYELQNMLFIHEKMEHTDVANFVRNLLILLYQGESTLLTKSPLERVDEFIKNHLEKIWHPFILNLCDNKEQPAPQKQDQKESKSQKTTILDISDIIHAINENPTNHLKERAIGLLLNKIAFFNREPDTAKGLLSPYTISLHSDITNERAKIIFHELTQAIMKFPSDIQSPPGKPLLPDNAIGTYLQNSILKLTYFIENRLFNHTLALSELAQQINSIIAMTNASKFSLTPTLLKQLTLWLTALQAPIVIKIDKKSDPALVFQSFIQKNFFKTHGTDEKARPANNQATEKNAALTMKKK